MRSLALFNSMDFRYLRFSKSLATRVMDLSLLISDFAVLDFLNFHGTEVTSE